MVPGFAKFKSHENYALYGIPAFFLGASGSKEPIKVMKIACLKLQIKIATFEEELQIFAVSTFLKINSRSYNNPWLHFQIVL